jgi:23S rRNA (cytidine2498-2'-O)-methyltransferase
MPPLPPPPPDSPFVRGDFLLIACQGGAEAAVRLRQPAVLPRVRPAAWRRGLVSFRLEDGFDPPDDFFPDVVFARAVIRCLGQVTGDSAATLAAAAVALAGPAAWRNVHVWARDSRAELPLAELRTAVLAACGLPTTTPEVAAAGDLVLDCVVDSPDRWWVGWHRVGCPASGWPGGVFPGALPEGKVSRAWLKLDEAIASLAIPLQAGERAVELGAAPGGSCQRLLEAGLSVVGIDPAVIADSVVAHPGFTHWRMRSRDVRLRAYRGFDWVVADMNIDPTSTMESLERVVTAPLCRPRGIIATLKLPEWSRAAAVDDWLAAFRGWGFRPMARQLSTGGREICVVALRGGGGRRVTRGRRPSRRRPAG